MIKNWFNNLFRKKASELPDLYNFKVLRPNELDDYADGLKRIYRREIDGIIVKNALNKTEIEKLIAFNQSLSKDNADIHFHPKGHVYPKPFSSLGNEIPHASEYFKRTGAVRKRFAEESTIDIENILFKLLKRMGGGRKVDSPKPKDLEGSCIPYGVRFLKPDTGGLEVHCGNLFHGNHDSFYGSIDDSVDEFNQLSYFFVLQPSESSDLVLLDKEWKDGQYKKEFGQMYTFTDENGNDVDCSEYGINRKTIKLEPGDFLTFAGGPIWHLVEEVKGEKGRLTVGGFLAFTHDDKEIQVWS